MKQTHSVIILLADYYLTTVLYSKIKQDNMVLFNRFVTCFLCIGLLHTVVVVLYSALPHPRIPRVMSRSTAAVVVRGLTVSASVDDVESHIIHRIVLATEATTVTERGAAIVLSQIMPILCLTCILVVVDYQY